MKKFRVVVNDSEYIVSVEPIEEDKGAAVATAPASKPAMPPTPQTSGNAAPPQEAAGGREQVNLLGTPLEAPLRGTILKVLVKEGQQVKAGDIMFTLEALKLENEITAPQDGVVAQVLVKAGDSVEPGDVLATFRA